jgi:hypothetical protein
VSKGTRTYTHVIRNGKPVTVPVPKGSVNDAGQFRENVLVGAAAGLLGRMLRGRS